MYLTLKALHLIAVISWMVGLLYLPRIFVYHADVKPDSDTYEIFSLMELRFFFKYFGLQSFPKEIPEYKVKNEIKINFFSINIYI